MPALTVSVIIPCYNEEEVLGRSIPAMLAQDYAPAPEFIFVDDGSTDKTTDVIRRYMAGSDRIRLFEQNHRGPACARNFAASQASGEVLVFIDADMIPEAAYVSMLLSPINNDEARGTFTSNEKVGNRGNYWADCWSLAGGCIIGDRFPTDYPAEAPVFRALLKKEFTRIGGYADVGAGGVGEDLTLSQKLGYSAIDAPLAVCLHDNPATFTDFWRSSAWYGKGWLVKYGARTLLSTLVKRNPLVSLFRNIAKKRFRHLCGVVLYDLAVICGMLGAFFRQQNYK